MVPNHYSLAVIKSCCKSATNISQKQEQMFFCNQEMMKI